VGNCVHPSPSCQSCEEEEEKERERETEREREGAVAYFIME